MLDETISQKLNEQITSELYASQIYLQMSLWCEDQGLEGSSKFFRLHVSEEISHRDRIIDYLNESGVSVAIEAIEKPRSDYSNLVEVVQAAFDHEALVTEQINTLAKSALDLSDFSTFNFLQWFIAEQREEMMLFRSVMDFIEKAGFTGAHGDQLVHVDAYLGSLNHE